MAAGDERRSGSTGDAHGLSYGWYGRTAATRASRKMQHGRLAGGVRATRVEGESPLLARVGRRGVFDSTVHSPYSELRYA